MKLSRIQIYVGSIVALAAAAVFLQDWGSLTELLVDPGTEDWRWDHIWGWVALLGLGLIAETLTLSIKVGRTAGATNSINFIPLLTSIILFGPVPTVLFWGITGVAGEFLIRKKEPIRAVFNSAQYVLSTSVAGWVYAMLGGGALVQMPTETSVLTDVIPFAAFGFVFLLLNHTAVSLAIAFSDGSSLRRTLPRLVGRTGTNLVYDLFVSPLAVALVLLYRALWILGLPLIILPLIFIRQAYQTIVQLQQANRDLLSALVKAIETRDPYTSGHSLRVASLAVRIAEAMGFSVTKQRDVETAAMLHDIGKIEAIYTEILGKPSDLTPEEREIIESHVTRGVELLEELSSFSKGVIAGVRGHHERADGKGYPEGLKGDQIPPIARIIKVCDSIDAMLSDRPYRNRLALAQVREQLVIYSGIQFDLEVVKAAIDGEVLETHQAEIAAQKQKEVSRPGHTEPEIPLRKAPVRVVS
jgi:putative nucleotidyltransferase with HDIG domain